MRRLTLLAAALAVACSSKKDDGDRTPPAVPVILFPGEGAALAARDLVGGLVAFSGTAEAGATVELVLDDAPAGSMVAAAGGTWTIAATAAEGAHAVRARATDAAGNGSGLGTPVSFSLDATPPAEPVVLAPQAGATVAAADLVAGQVVFSGTAEPSTTVEVQVDGAAVATTVALPDGTWSVGATLADGSHAVRALALDAVANPSTLSPAVSFTVDTGAPAVPHIAAPIDGAALVWTDLVNGQVVFRGTADAGDTVWLEVDGLQAGSTPVVIPSPPGGVGGAWSIAVTLASGAHTARARAVDAASNASPLSSAVAFTLDATRLALPIPAGSPLPVTSWGQTIGVTPGEPSGFGELFPGQANSWVVAPDLSFGAGFGLEYVNALVLYTGTPTGTVSHDVLLNDLIARRYVAFPGDQGASEAVFLTPLFGVPDGVVTAAASGALAPDVPVISGSASGYLNGTSDSRLSRTLALDPAQTYTFGWTHQAVLATGALTGAGAPPFAPSYQVVLRDPATGAIVGAPLFSSSTHVLRATESVTASGLPAQVVLSFELRSAAPGYAQIDGLTLTSGNGAVTLDNPGFEAGLTGWDVNDGAQSQNVRSGARDVGAGASALRVTRTVYAPPAAAWARLVDVFENTGGADVTTTAIYVTLLGGGDTSLAAVTQNGVVGWDGGAAVRDVGIVYGVGNAYVADRSPYVFVTHGLTVPAGGKVALAHFVVQLGEAAGGPTSLPIDVPQQTDQECGAILAGFPALEPYRVDLEPGVRALVGNF